MIPFIRSYYNHYRREAVSILVECHWSEADFLRGAQPISSFYLNCDQAELSAAGGGVENWGDADVLAVGRTKLDGHEVYGGRGLVLMPAPDPLDVDAEVKIEDAEKSGSGADAARQLAPGAAPPSMENAAP